MLIIIGFLALLLLVIKVLLLIKDKDNFIKKVFHDTFRLINKYFLNILLILFIYFIITFILLLIPFIGVILAGLFTLNLYAISYKLIKYEVINIKDLFDFSSTIRLIECNLYVFFKLLIPYCITVFISLIGFFYIIDIVDNSNFNILAILVSIALIFLPMLYLYIKSIQYILTIYICLDNVDLTLKECINLSKTYMKGKVLLYVISQIILSFLIIISCIPFGLGLIYTIPIALMINAVFYKQAIIHNSEI